MKKVISVILIMVLCVNCIVGCSKKKVIDIPEQNVESTEQKAVETKASAEGNLYTEMMNDLNKTHKDDAEKTNKPDVFQLKSRFDEDKLSGSQIKRENTLCFHLANVLRDTPYNPISTIKNVAEAGYFTGDFNKVSNDGIFDNYYSLEEEHDSEYIYGLDDEFVPGTYDYYMDAEKLLDYIVKILKNSSIIFANIGDVTLYEADDCQYAYIELTGEYEFYILTLYFKEYEGKINTISAEIYEQSISNDKNSQHYRWRDVDDALCYFASIEYAFTGYHMLHQYCEKENRLPRYGDICIGNTRSNVRFYEVHRQQKNYAENGFLFYYTISLN